MIIPFIKKRVLNYLNRNNQDYSQVNNSNNTETQVEESVLDQSTYELSHIEKENERNNETVNDKKHSQ